MTIDLARLAQFLVLEEERNYGRAADRLGITQPALTRHIHKLERQLGSELLLRTRPLQLTAAGVVALRHTRTLLTLAERADSDIRAAGVGSPNVLRWGVPPAGSPAAVLRVIRQVHQRSTELRSLITPMTYSDCLESVLTGITDVGVLSRAATLVADLDGILIDRDRLVVAAADNHRYASRPYLTAAELAEERWIVPGPGTAPPEIHAFLEPFLAARTPQVIESSLPASLDLVATGVGVAVLPGHAAERQSVAGVRYLPLADAPTIDVGLFWRSDLDIVDSVLIPNLPEALDK